MSRRGSSGRTGHEGAFADQSAQGRSDYSEGPRSPGQGSGKLGAEDGDRGHDAAGSPSRQGPVPGSDRKPD